VACYLLQAHRRAHPLQMRGLDLGGEADGTMEVGDEGAAGGESHHHLEGERGEGGAWADVRRRSLSPSGTKRMTC